MRARSFSHVGITVADFNRTVRFYWDVFGCPLVGVADTPPERVRSFFGVEGDAPTLQDRLDPGAGRRGAGDLRVPARGSRLHHPLESGGADPLLVQRAKHAAVVRLPASERRRVPVAAGDARRAATPSSSRAT